MLPFSPATADEYVYGRMGRMLTPMQPYRHERIVSSVFASSRPTAAREWVSEVQWKIAQVVFTSSVIITLHAYAEREWRESPCFASKQKGHHTAMAEKIEWNSQSERGWAASNGRGAVAWSNKLLNIDVKWVEPAPVQKEWSMRVFIFTLIQILHDIWPMIYNYYRVLFECVNNI